MKSRASSDGLAYGMSPHFSPSLLRNLMETGGPLLCKGPSLHISASEVEEKIVNGHVVGSSSWVLICFFPFRGFSGTLPRAPPRLRTSTGHHLSTRKGSTARCKAEAFKKCIPALIYINRTNRRIRSGTKPNQQLIFHFHRVIMYLLKVHIPLGTVSTGTFKERSHSLPRRAVM